MVDHYNKHYIISWKEKKSNLLDETLKTSFWASFLIEYIFALLFSRIKQKFFSLESLMRMWFMTLIYQRIFSILLSKRFALQLPAAFYTSYISKKQLFKKFLLSYSVFCGSLPYDWLKAWQYLCTAALGLAESRRERRPWGTASARNPEVAGSPRWS